VYIKFVAGSAAEGLSTSLLHLYYMGGKFPSMTPAYRRVLESEQYPDREQELELIARYRAGDRSAGEKLVLSNQRYVIRAAAFYARRTPGISIEDLINEGNIGLLAALDKYDPNRGTRFITCAGAWIKAHIRGHVIMHGKPVRLTTTKAKRRMHSALPREKRRVENELASKHGTSPVYLQNEIYERLGEHFGASAEDIRMFEHAQRPYSRLDVIGAVSPGDGSPEGIELGIDTGEDFFDKMTSGSLGDILAEAMGTLTAREREILGRHFGIGRKDQPYHEPETLQKIGRDYKVSRERIRQIKEGAIRKLRAIIEENLMQFPYEHLPYDV